MRQNKAKPYMPATLQICAMLLVFVVASSPAVAETEALVSDETTNALAISMEGYAPDKTEWSKKASAKYEKNKDRGGPLRCCQFEGMGRCQGKECGGDGRERSHCVPSSRASRSRERKARKPRGTRTPSRRKWATVAE